jgi:pimeloyl-ACP methyl ester carboxylesterase
VDFARGIPFRAGLIVAALTARGPQDAQAPKAPAADDLHAAVELCFSTIDDAKAAEQIDDTVAKFGADPAALLKAVGTPPPKPSGDSLTLRVPFRGQALVATVALPKNAAGAPPVVADISGDTGEKTFHWTTAASCRVSGYTPPHLTDECRDSFGKVLHAVSFAVGGDPDRLWMTGMSWGGHAAFDIASHRPGLVRGFVSLAGGPRRNHFRLFKNYGATSITALIGAKDDPDVVWNLEEMGRAAKGLGLDWHFTLDPEGGHKLPLAGMDDVAARVDTTAALPAKIPDHGTLLADADLVALPWLEVVEVDPAAVAVPDKFPIDGSLSMDEKRRAMVKSMSGQFAKVDWKLTKEKDGDGVALELSAKGVKRAAVLVKAPWFDLGRPLKVVVNKKKFCEGAIAVDPATVLKEARRTGDRQRPTVMRVEVKF